MANHEPFIVIPTDEDRYWNYLHRFDSDGRGDKAWFDNGRDISFGGGWGDAPGIAEEFPSYHAVPRLLLRSNGGPVTFGVPLGAPNRSGFLFFMKPSGMQEGYPALIGEIIDDAVLIDDESAAVLSTNQTTLGLSKVHMMHGSVLGWGTTPYTSGERVQGVNLAKFSDGKFVAGAIFETQD